MFIEIDIRVNKTRSGGSFKRFESYVIVKNK